ncbi:LOW QUALITY PROTEIN: glyoxal reductase [Cyprinus carpio]|uniref:LOW QUALITY PROTEIN: glyoxal reductase n=1 Tax=Cyprinus carpio TaxID=7962 RepID=A0A9Q9VLU9_CYPCA|nr:LOW QUALITY PROTEIN: glyoxal reductase [Cyprinus carpio]
MGAVYGNEAHLGQVLKELEAKEGCLRSLEKLDCKYINLYWHWPGVEGLDPGDSRHSEYRAQSWAALEEFYASGQFRAIGVSNYTAKHIWELLMSCRVAPSVPQIECQPKIIQRKPRDLCTLYFGFRFNVYYWMCNGGVLGDGEVMDIVRSCGRTPAQVLLRWAVQQGISVLPRSSQPCRVQENAQVFDFQLSEMDIVRLDALNCGTRFCKRDSSKVA